MHVVVGRFKKAIDFEAVRCLECQMKVVTFVVVGVTTAGERVVAPAALTDRTA